MVRTAEEMLTILRKTSLSGKEARKSCGRAFSYQPPRVGSSKEGDCGEEVRSGKGEIYTYYPLAWAGFLIPAELRAEDLRCSRCKHI